MFDPFDLNKDGKLDLMEDDLKFQAVIGEDDDDEEDDPDFYDEEVFEDDDF